MLKQRNRIKEYFGIDTVCIKSVDVTCAKTDKSLIILCIGI